ncbi:hypothetical protein AB0395_41315 [Streptosporangium sp. NPDC051023]|uniref:hypothetical protein n=1 Tax=Streptosporangium sp. NPDC051023 TaxID=3155410 RepID=UPI00344B1191
MAIETIPRGSREYLSVVVEGDSSVTSLSVEMAVLAYGTRPADSDWQAAEWDVDDGDGAIVAKILIGPGTSFDFSLTPGTKVPWARVAAGQEEPEMEGEPFQIT